MVGPLIDDSEVRAAVVYEIVARMGDVGKTQIHKLAYFLQEQLHLPLKCKFYIHQFGPYSDEIERTISDLGFMEYVRVTPDPNGYGFHAQVSSPPEHAWKEIIESSGAAIRDLLAKVGDKDARELELLATLHYLSRSEGTNPDDLIPVAKRVKPKFPEPFISRKLAEMTDLGLLG